MQLSAFIIPTQPRTERKNSIKVCMILLNILQTLTNILIRTLTSWHQLLLDKVMRPKDNLRGNINKIPSSSAVWITWRLLFFFFPFIFISWRLITLQHCSGFCHTLKWISHGFTCIPHPSPPSHLPLHLIPLHWVFPVHQAWALVSCIQPGLVICFTLDNIHVSMLFSWNIPPSPYPIESKSLFYTSESLFLFCI